MDSQQTAQRESEEPIDDAELSLRAWVARNGPTLMFVLVALIGFYYWVGLSGMWNVAKVILGIGAVIFIHELGHFLVAKWCDVHVQTFSIGFGPALPGCSFKRGETTYKIALFPLGGYVKMVGEGGENDEEDTDPRSYKNKSVGQRMAIISAGVVMNLLFGLVVFIAAFKMGVHQMAPDVGVVEAGGPAWQKGVRFGDVFTQVGNNDHPSFEDLRADVMLTHEGEQVPFVFLNPSNGESRSVTIQPRKARGEPNPVIGVRWAMELKLPPKRRGDRLSGPFAPGSAAAAACPLDLKPDDQLIEATDPDHPDGSLTALPSGAAGYAELGDRLRRLTGKSVTLKVRRGSAEETRTLEPGSGFEFEDSILATTDPDGDNPFQVKPLPTDPRDPHGRHLDYFEFIRRLGRLAGRPVVVEVRRNKAPEKETVEVFVPASFHRVLPGVTMRMGAVTALRDGSSAAAHGVKSGDYITAITLTDRKGESMTLADKPGQGEKLLNPVRLPFDVRQWAVGRAGVTADLKVLRAKEGQKQAPDEVRGLAWDEAWASDEELPLGVNANMAIPELGIAYQAAAQVHHIDRSAAGVPEQLQEGDFVLAWKYQEPPKKPGDEPTWLEKSVDLRPADNPKGDPEPRFAGTFAEWQMVPYPRVKLLVRHLEGSQEEEIEVELRRDADWPQFSAIQPLGLEMMVPQERIAVAGNMGEAIQLGLRYTTRRVTEIYMFLRSLVTLRVSPSKTLQGPIDIAVIAYDQAGRDFSDFLLLLGLISVNLAVVNFLPIPILDGGHMVFLIYEKLRGKPASEHVRMAANWVGLLFLVSLMGFVIYLGVSRWIWPLISG